MPEGSLKDEEGRIAALERYAILDTASEKPFEKITSLVKSILKVPICAVSLVDRERQWFKSIQGLDVRETPRSVSFCTYTIQTYESLIVTDALNDARFKHNPLVLGSPHIRSYAGVPLTTADGFNVGALCAIHTEPRDFSEAQIGILESFASLVVDELELRRIAERDHLTGAMSRRSFVKQMEKEIARFRRHQRDSVLILLDLDHFKAVNDRYGHPAGDEVLRAVSLACCKELRANDAFGRLGGEEFGVLLSETDAAGGWDAAEKFRRTIEDLFIDVGEKLRVTSSFGLASLTDSVSSAEDWIAEADEALYSAKRQGRNRCVVKSQASNAVAA